MGQNIFFGKKSIFGSYEFFLGFMGFPEGMGLGLLAGEGNAIVLCI